MTSISMDTYIYGMAVRGRTLYHCAGSKGIKMLNLSDESKSNVINSNMLGVYYVATSGDKLYYANINTHTVKCCDLNGTTQWEFKDDRVLQGPVGISVDNDGNVYTVGFYSNNVVVISPNGQRHRQLLSSNDGLISPRVLDYDRSTNRLPVVNNSSAAFLFDVTTGRCNSNNVVVFFPEGQRHRQLLYFKDDIVLPCVLDYDNMLFVVNNSTTAFLFDVTG